MRLKLTLQYNGHPYGGWQYQSAKGTPVKPSVQGTVAEALNQLLVTHTLQPKELIAAGRTDAGVHAHGQVAHADIPDIFSNRPVHTFIDGLNRYLPLSIRCIAAEAVPLTFHARFSATARHYVYRLWAGRQMRPDLLHFVGHAPPLFGTELNLAAMQQAIASLPVDAPTDFSSLRDAECQSRNPICTLTHARFIQVGDQLHELELGADHFLHHMVRNLVGTLVQVGMNERDPDLRGLLAAHDRRQAGTTFAPDGLFLQHIAYLNL